LSAPAIEITRLAKTTGPLTKRISLAPDGSLLSDGSACTMSTGTGWRTIFATLAEFADGISGLSPNEAIALGTLRSDLPNEVQIVTKRQLEKLNGTTADNLIARSADYIVYRFGQPALALIDIDTKGMPDAVGDKIREYGGFRAALAIVVPALEQTAQVVRRSTSTGISRTDTGAPLPGSNGAHIFPLVKDGSDVDRFTRTLHDRCWLAGLGWMMVGAGGQLLERSIVDRMVGAPERLVFEGAPVLDPPLLQDLASRKATVTDGEPLDTLAACSPLTIVEQAKLCDLRAKEAHRLAPDRAKAREQFITEQAARIAARTGCTVHAARRTVEKQCDGVLLSGVLLAFDDADTEGCTVNDVLADPNRFVGATLADPLEGIAYGRCKAMVMRRADGSIWINSFAHGRTVYELQHDGSAAQLKLRSVAPADVPDEFVRIVLESGLDETETDDFRNLAHDISGIGKRALDAKLKTARKKQAKGRAEARRHQRAAERSDPRPQIKVPLGNDPWLIQMAVVNEVQGSSRITEPPTRDAEGDRSRLKMRTFPRLHLLSTSTSNPDPDPAPGDHE
jgi:hypothetical protein